MPGMTSDPEAYFRAFIPSRDGLLFDLERQAHKKSIPIVGPVVGELLRILVAATNSKAILELGTATGYSTIYLARGINAPDGWMITVERDEVMAAEARVNLAKAGLADRVEVRVGDAGEVMTALEGPYDLIFMDIDKEGYAQILPQCLRLLKMGGLLIADNVAFQAADEFNQKIFADPRWRTVHLYSFLPSHSPERDAVTLAIRIG